MRRRTALSLAGAGLLAACGALPRVSGLPWPDDARIVETASGRELTAPSLVERILATPIVLLGERHDNPAHHRLRAELIDRWGRRARDRPHAVVFEQLDREHEPALREAQRRQPASGPTPSGASSSGASSSGAAAASGAAIAHRLDLAGFDRTAWRWPLHQPLFEAADRIGAIWIAANFSRAAAGRLMRPPPGGAPSVDPALAAMVDSARWDDAAQQALEAALRAGHCNLLPEAAIPGIARVQRLRDAALALPLLDAAERRMILIAGNGHVRRDFGVPRYLGAFEQAALVVGFEEGELPADAAAMYDVVVLATPVARKSPC
ncbi:MAG: ChaN family lipoprotein [Lautropia sp.]